MTFVRWIFFIIIVIFKTLITSKNESFLSNGNGLSLSEYKSSSHELRKTHLLPLQGDGTCWQTKTPLNKQKCCHLEPDRDLLRTKLSFALSITKNFHQRRETPLRRSAGVGPSLYEFKSSSHQLRRTHLMPPPRRRVYFFNDLPSSG